MPDFDGTGPLKRGRVIGRGRGPCRNEDKGCERRTGIPDPVPVQEKPEE
nr:DUF5320 family protein [uncultured Methanoregula sp.]